MKPDDQLIAEVRELDAKATPGPWVSKINHAPYKCVWFDPEGNYTTLELKAEDADFIAAARTLLPDLANRLEAALKAIEDAPHGHDCKLGRPNKLKTGTVDFPCTCWKSRALNKPTKPTP